LYAFVCDATALPGKFAWCRERKIFATLFPLHGIGTFSLVKMKQRLMPTLCEPEPG